MFETNIPKGLLLSGNRHVVDIFGSVEDSIDPTNDPNQGRKPTTFHRFLNVSCVHGFVASIKVARTLRVPN